MNKFKNILLFSSLFLLSSNAFSDNFDFFKNIKSYPGMNLRYPQVSPDFYYKVTDKLSMGDAQNKATIENLSPYCLSVTGVETVQLEDQCKYYFDFNLTIDSNSDAFLYTIFLRLESMEGAIPENTEFVIDDKKGKETSIILDGPPLMLLHMKRKQTDFSFRLGLIISSESKGTFHFKTEYDTIVY